VTRWRHALSCALLAASCLLCSCLPNRRTERPSPAEQPTAAPAPGAGPAAPAPAVTAPAGPSQPAGNASSTGNGTAPAGAAQSSAPPGAARPAPQVPRPKPSPPTTRSTLPAGAAPAAKPAAAAAPALDLTALEQRLRDTSAIGVFTKLTLKNQVDDLLSRFRLYHSGHGDVKLEQLRQSYDLLLLKVLSLLQDKDSGLANAISASREAIWNILIDPKKFAAID